MFKWIWSWINWAEFCMQYSGSNDEINSALKISHQYKPQPKATKLIYVAPCPPEIRKVRPEGKRRPLKNPVPQRRYSDVINTPVHRSVSPYTVQRKCCNCKTKGNKTQDYYENSSFGVHNRTCVLGVSTYRTKYSWTWTLREYQSEFMIRNSAEKSPWDAKSRQTGQKCRSPSWNMKA